MDFNDTPEEAKFRVEVRAWLEANAKPKDPNKARAGRSNKAEADRLASARVWQAKKAEAGYAAITWPTEFGGLGGSSIQSVIYSQEESNFEVPGGFFDIGLGMCIPTMMAWATKEQNERFVKPALYGEEIWCQLFSEPSAGSDVAGLRTKAERDGDDWVINGQKVWTSGAHYCDYGIIVTRSDPTAPKHKGLTFFFLDMKSPGIECRPIHQISGASNFNEVFFTDVRVPDAYRVGDIGEGWKVALSVLGFERGSSNGSSRVGGNWAQAKGLAQHLGVTSDPVVRDDLARLYSQYRIMALNNQRVAAQTKAGQAPGPEGSISKMIWVKSMNLMSDVITKILGPRITADTGEWGTYEWNEHLLGAPGYRIAGGSDEIQRNIVGERVLGLPGEPRTDKNVPFKDIPK